MDYYRTLGIGKTSTQDDIKRAYKKLAMQHHPDRPDGNAEEFKRVTEAYETLKDPVKRKQYDQPQETNNFGFYIAGLFIAIMYYLVILSILEETQNTPIYHKLPADATCVITNEPIPAGGMYYKCDQCIAVYDYEAIQHNWLNYSNKCGYCSKSIKVLFKYCNV